MNTPQYRFGGLVTKLCLTLCVACQAPLSMGFPRQEYWSGLCFLLQGAFPTQRWNLHLFSLAGGFVTAEPPRKPQTQGGGQQKKFNAYIMDRYDCPF